MRLIVVPLSLKTSMLYCQKSAIPLSVRKPRIDDRLVARLTKTWDGWTKSDQKLKKTIVGWANSAMERISYEEWGLKSIPHQSKSARVLVEASKEAGEQKLITTEDYKVQGLAPKDVASIPVIFPRSVLDQQEVVDRLQKLATKGISQHTKYFWISLIGAPLTLPVALIPVMPNIPGFYLLFRAWSNWNAAHGARHLNYLLKDDHLSFESLEPLDRMFARLFKESKARPLKDGDRIILEESHIDELVEIVGAKELGPELHRAVRQTKRHLS